MTRSSRLPLALCSALAVLVLGVTGCSDDGSDVRDGGTGSNGSASGEGSASQ